MASDEGLDEKHEKHVQNKETIDQMVDDLSADYANYLAIDSSLQKKSVDEAIEEALLHLEEFCGLLDMIRSDNILCLEQVLSRIYEKSLQMEGLYEEVDKLEDMVGVVKRSVEEMEVQVIKAEKLLSSSGSLKRFFTSMFNNSKSKYSPTSRRPKYIEPDIFRTDHLFKASLSGPTCESLGSKAGTNPASGSL